MNSLTDTHAAYALAPHVDERFLTLSYKLIKIDRDINVAYMLRGVSSMCLQVLKHSYDG